MTEPASAHEPPVLPCRVRLDDRGESVTAFDRAFTELIQSARGREVRVGEAIDDVFGPGHVDAIRVAIDRARDRGVSPAMLNGWGVRQRNYRSTVRHDPSAPGFDLHFSGVEAGDALDPENLLPSALSQNVTEMIAIVDRDLRILASNAPYAVGAAMLLGRELRIGDDMRSMMAPGTVSMWEALYARALRGEAVLEDVAVKLSIGVERTYEISLNPLRTCGSQIDGVLLISRNVTSHRFEAEAMKRAAEVRRAVIEAMPQAITIFKRDGTIVDFKGAPGVPIPFEPQSLIGKNVRDLEHAPTERIYQMIQEAFQSRHTATLEYEAELDGKVRIREATLRAISDDEAVWAVNDVTEQRQAAGRLAFADRMASLGTLAAGVAHELNNPLAYVTANLQFLTKSLASHPGFGTEHGVALSEALEGLGRMRSIVASLTTFSHPNENATSRFDLRTVVSSAAKLASREIAGRGALEIELGEESVAVEGSESRLTQVFLNLLLNAAQALEPAQKAKNRVRVTLAVRQDGIVVVEVADNGGGIPADIVSRIFDPFFTTKPVGMGTGLGLAIAQQIVQALGGHIELESTEGRGSRFSVMLKVAATAAAPRKSTPPAMRKAVLPSRPNATILLIDDDRAVRSALRRLLSNWKVTVAESAEEGLAVLETQPFDLVICDVMMPGASGVDFFVAVASRWPERAARVVLMTGGVVALDQQARLGDAAPTILRKPFGTDAVEACLLALSEAEDAARPR